MAEYGGLQSQMQGPQVDISLFPNAMRAGAEVGNAVKTPLQGYAEGITKGISNYQDVQAKGIANDKAQQELESQPAVTAADIAYKQAIAREADARSQIDQFNVQTAQATNEYTTKQKIAEAQAAASKAQNDLDIYNAKSSLGQAIQSQDPNAINQALNNKAIMAYATSDPAGANGMLMSAAGVQGVDQELLKKHNQFASSQYQAQMLAMKKNTAYQGMTEASSKLDNDPYLSTLATMASTVTGGTPLSNRDMAERMDTVGAGTMTVGPNGTLVPTNKKTFDAKLENADVFFNKPNADGSDHYYLVASGVPLDKLQDQAKYKSNLHAYTQASTLPSPTGAAPAPQADRIHNVAGQQPTPGFDVTGQLQGKGSTSSTLNTQSLNNAKQTMVDYTLGGESNRLHEDLTAENSPVKMAAKSLFKLQTDDAVNSAAPAIVAINNALKTSSGAQTNWYQRLTGSPVTQLRAELEAPKMEIAKAVASSEYATASDTTKSLYNDEAVKNYQQKRDLLKNLRDQLINYSGDYATRDVLLNFENSQTLAEMETQYPIDIENSEDLYYARNKKNIDSTVEAGVNQLQTSYRNNINKYPDTVKAKNEISDELRNNAGSTAPIYAPQPVQKPTKGVNVNTEEVKNLVSQKAAEYGLPVDKVLNLVQQESGFREHAQNPASSAHGPMQLVKRTARDLGVDRMDPAQNIEGGMKLLAHLYKKYGNWEDTVQAYHDGETAFDKNHGPIPGNQESMNYVKDTKAGA